MLTAYIQMIRMYDLITQCSFYNLTYDQPANVSRHSHLNNKV